MGYLQTIDISDECADELFLAQQVMLINLFKTGKNGVTVLVPFQFNLSTLFLSHGHGLIVIVIGQRHP